MLLSLCTAGTLYRAWALLVFLVNRASPPGAASARIMTWACWASSLTWCALHVLLGRVCILPQSLASDRVTSTYMKHAGLIHVVLDTPGAIILWCLLPSEFPSECMPRNC